MRGASEGWFQAEAVEGARTLWKALERCGGRTLVVPASSNFESGTWLNHAIVQSSPEASFLYLHSPGRGGRGK